MTKKKPERLFVFYIVIRCYQGCQRKEVEDGVVLQYDGTWHEVARFVSLSATRAKLELVRLQNSYNYREAFLVRPVRFPMDKLPDSFKPALAGDLIFGE